MISRLSKSNLTLYQSKKKMNTYNTIKLFYIPVKINNILKHFNDFNGIFPEIVKIFQCKNNVIKLSAFLHFSLNFA